MNKTLFFCVIFFFLIPSSLFSQKKHFDEEQLFQYAQLLFLQNNCTIALLEYRRFIELFPKSTLNQRAYSKMAQCYFLNQNYEQSIRLLEKRLLSKAPIENGDHHYYLLALSWLNLDSFSPFALRKPFIEQGIINLKRIKNYRKEYINNFLEELKLAPKPDYKSPLLAGVLSAFIPGSGSFYANRWAEGGYSIFLNALFGFAAADAFQKQANTLGSILSVVTLSFYGGGIYSAINSVHHHNDQLDAHRFTNIRKRFRIVYQKDF